ncbi:MAG: cyclic nucleotide-binding protein [Thalassobius sp.]|nr:cyclic nucleotide-binding protein [Thalassovita sp.]
MSDNSSNLFIVFKKMIHHFEQIDDSNLQHTFDKLKVLKPTKNSFLLHSNEICKYMYFVVEGLGRSFYITKTGQEKTRRITVENQILTVLQSFARQEPSIESIQLLEDSVLLAMHRDVFFGNIEQYPAWDRYYRKILEEAFIFQNKKIEHHVTLTAKERYDLLVELRPEYLQRLSNKVLASFLDLREETLSRLKSKSRF